MIDLLLQIGATKLILSAALGAGAWMVARARRGPAVEHGAWLIVLAALLTPALIAVPTAFGWPDTAETTVALGATSAPGQRLGPTAALAAWPELEAVAATLVAFWLAGTALLVLASLLRAMRFGRALRSASRRGTDELAALAAEVAAELGLARAPSIRTTTARVSPLVWWTGGRVRVLIPEGLVRSTPPDRLRWILAHELAHVRRKDHAVRWVEWLACTLFWWNPVAWWARRRLKAAGELCCDATVMSSLRPPPREYAAALLTVVDFLATPRTLRAPAFASEADCGGNPSLTERRLRMILDSTTSAKPTRRARTILQVAAALLLPLGLVYCGPEDAGNPLEPDAPESRVQDGMDELERTEREMTARIHELDESDPMKADMARRVEAAYRELRQEFEAAVADGTLEPEEAETRLERRMDEVLARAEAGRSLRPSGDVEIVAPEPSQNLKVYLERESRRLRSLLETGQISAEDAERTMEELHLRLREADATEAHRHRD